MNVLPLIAILSRRRSAATNTLADDRTSAEVIAQFYKLPYGHLVKSLERNRLIENGYAERDLALRLVAFHDFDLQRVLSAMRKRINKECLHGSLIHHESTVVTVYPSLYESAI